MKFFLVVFIGSCFLSSPLTAKEKCSKQVLSSNSRELAIQGLEITAYKDRKLIIENACNSIKPFRASNNKKELKKRECLAQYYNNKEMRSRNPFYITAYICLHYSRDNMAHCLLNAMRKDGYLYVVLNDEIDICLSHIQDDGSFDQYRISPNFTKQSKDEHMNQCVYDYFLQASKRSKSLEKKYSDTPCAEVVKIGDKTRSSDRISLNTNEARSNLDQKVPIDVTTK